MKKSLMTLVLVLAVASVSFAQQPSAPQGAGQPAQQGAPAQKKEIKDPAEYNAYMGAIQASDPNAKVQGLEGFIGQYPNSVMKEDALELLMRTYQQLGNVPKTMETANRVLQVNPNNVTSLALLSYLHRLQAQQGGPNAAQDLAAARQFGEKGLQALPSYQKPENMSDLDFAKLKDQLAGIFNGSIGIAALQGNDFPTAQKSLQDAVNTTPNDFSLVYPLALSYLNQPNATPQAQLEGLWYIARATNLAPTPQYKQQIGEFGRRKYMKYHGGDDGWTDVVAAAASAPTPPQGWTIKPAPTPAEQAANMVQSKPVSQMSFDEIQFILSSGNQQAADTVWNAIKDKPLALGGGKVITASPTQLTIAESYDDINSTPPKADITLHMAGEIPAKLMPKEGQNIDIQGRPQSYTPNPFMMILTDGALVRAKGAEPPPKHTTPTHRPTHKKPS
ncbi:MAG: tetratricopeptide repeat protein [Terriglobales bacterium]